MKRVLCLIAALLMLSFSACADGLSLTELTTEQLLDLRNRIDAELEASHSVAGDSEARLIALALAALTEAGRPAPDVWLDRSVSREWDLLILTATVTMTGGIVSRDVPLRLEAVLSESDERAVYLSLDGEALLDRRDSLTDPRLLAMLGLAAPSEPGSEADAQTAYVLNTHTERFHRPDCASVADIKPENRQDSADTRDALIARGYRPCGRCNP